MAAALADDFAEIVLGIAMLGDQLLIAERLLQRIEIGALDVLDDREFQRRLVVHVTDDDRNFDKARQLRGAPAPFAGDDLVNVRLGDRAERRPAGRCRAARIEVGEILQFVLGEDPRGLRGLRPTNSIGTIAVGTDAAAVGAIGIG